VAEKMEFNSFEGQEIFLIPICPDYGRNLGFLDWSCYFFFQVAPQYICEKSI
jgi:hypothetical protein